MKKDRLTYLKENMQYGDTLEVDALGYYIKRKCSYCDNEFKVVSWYMLQNKCDTCRDSVYNSALDKMINKKEG